MKRSKFFAAILAAGLIINPIVALAFIPPPSGGNSGHISGGTAWWILACPGDVVAAAIVKNWKRHKELTQQEAWTCGLLYWWNEGRGVYGR